MLSYIKGKLVEKQPASVIMEVNGMGYLLQVSLNTFSAIQDKSDCKLFTHLNVKNEGQSVSAFELFGFATEDERAVFEQLISVSGIGANTARMMLSSLSPEEVRSAIVNGNVELIKSVKGIGPKTAQRAILELKDKIGTASGETVKISAGSNSMKEEALSALISLGFARPTATKAVEQVISSTSVNTVEQLIKETLKKL